MRHMDYSRKFYTFHIKKTDAKLMGEDGKCYHDGRVKCHAQVLANSAEFW